jgi:enoyl-CoA hydratase/carnithine racemase
VFCAGGDLNRLAQRRAMTPPDRRAGVEVLHTMIRAIRDCSKPVIAAVEGAAAGAGLSIALACDLLVAARNASFSVAYVKVGLSPDAGATAFLSGCVSRQLLTELCLTGKPVTGERMHALGVANRLAEPERALTEALAMAQLLAAGPDRAIARIKNLCRRAGENTLDAQLDLEADYMTESLGDDESAEGIGAFFGKRPADYVALRRGAAVQPS